MIDDLSSRQAAFIEAIHELGAVSPITRGDLLDFAHEAGWSTIPPWITKDADRRIRHGVYSIPELNGESNAAATPVVAAAPAPSESVVAATYSAKLSSVERDGTEATIPAKRDTYVPWGYFKDLETVIRSESFFPVYITGLSGNGKTTMVEQVCAKAKRNWVRLNITKQTNEDDLLGGFRLIDGNTVWQDGPVVNAMLNGGVLLLDEVDLGTEKIMCLQSVLEGKGVYLKKVNRWIAPAAGFTVVATANTKGKGSDDGRFVGTRVMNEAFLDRFDYTFEQEYAPRTTERKIVLKAMQKFGKTDDAFADALTKWAEAGRTTFKNGGIDEIISTRRLINICKAYAVFNDKTKAVKMCLSRFDANAQKSFLDSLDKFMVPEAVAPAPAAAAAPTADSTKCPF